MKRQMSKLNLQQTLLQSSVSHDPSEIIIIYWFGALYFCENGDTFFQDSLEQKILKNSIYLKSFASM